MRKQVKKRLLEEGWAERQEVGVLLVSSYHIADATDWFITSPYHEEGGGFYHTESGANLKIFGVIAGLREIQALMY